MTPFPPKTPMQMRREAEHEPQRPSPPPGPVDPESARPWRATAMTSPSRRLPPTGSRTSRAHAHKALRLLRFAPRPRSKACLAFPKNNGSLITCRTTMEAAYRSIILRGAARAIHGMHHRRAQAAVFGGHLWVSRLGEARPHPQPTDGSEPFILISPIYSLNNHYRLRCVQRRLVLLIPRQSRSSFASPVASEPPAGPK
jgi:hypothetical protein